MVIGTALYCSRAVLDRTTVGDPSVRVAFLPSPEAWFGFVMMAVLAVWWLVRGVRRPSAGPDTRRLMAVDLLRPTLVLVALTIPYWPWIADRLPALQMFAGPGRVLVWLLVMAMIMWTLWQGRPWRAPWTAQLSTTRLAAAILVGTLAMSALAAAKLTGTTLFPSGDEPHYLVISQSLWRDGDLAIENNHARADYGEYFDADLDPHYVTRGGDGQIYSIHPVGLPVLLAPVYAAGGYRLVVAALIVMAAAAAAMMWRWTALALRDRGAATFAWAATAATAPFLLNTFTVYPEIAAALAAVVAFTVGLGLGQAPRVASGLLVGAAVALLPWLSTKYAPMSTALVAVVIGRLWIRSMAVVIGRPWIRFGWEHEAPTTSRVATSLAIATPYAASLVAWSAFFYAYWGSPWPQAPYGSLVQTDISNLVFGAPGLLFDQEYGVIAYAPVYVLALTGLVHLWRARGDDRRRAIEIAIVSGALLGTVGAFRIWWGGSASPGRPMASALLLFALPIAAAFRAAAPSLPRRAAHHALLWLSIGMAATLVFAQDGLLINNGRDGSSALLEYLSPLWEAWTLAPSFIHHEAGTALIHTLAWLAIAWAAAIALGRVRTTTAGGAALSALAALGAALIAVAIVVPWLPSDPPHPPLDLQARSRIGALDSFDRGIRPFGVIYDPIRIAPVAEVLASLTLGVGPGMHRGAQPVRVLHNGRFSLPAGRYRVEMKWRPEDAFRVSGPQRIELQVGRIGPPLERWSVEASPGGQSGAEFVLPVDAGFVGFRGSTDVERSLASITIAPVDVVDAVRRTRTPQVLSAIRYASTVVLFHDEQVYPEPAGFWTVPGRTTSVTLALSTADAAPAALHLHPGLTPNHVGVMAYGWRRDLDLTPEVIETVHLPDPSRRIVPVSFETATGFVPAERDSRSRDKRRLGAWVEVAQP